MIYHYTDVTTLIKILESKVIWLSDLSKMNDPREYTEGFELVNKQFMEIFPLNKSWLSSNSFNGNSTNKMVMSCSFSKKGDDLSQWRAYGDNGSGVAIGISKDLVIENNRILLAGMQPKEPITREPIIFYDAIYQKRKFIENVTKVLKSHEFIQGESFTLKEPPRYKDFMLALELSRLSCCYKSPFYENEQEVRCIADIHIGMYKQQTDNGYNPFKIKFRQTTYGLTPYSELQLNKGPISAIKTIILGPRNIDKCSDIEFMLSVLGMENVEVIKSKGNYR